MGEGHKLPLSRVFVKNFQFRGLQLYRGGPSLRLMGLWTMYAHASEEERRIRGEDHNRVKTQEDTIERGKYTYIRGEYTSEVNMRVHPEDNDIGVSLTREPLSQVGFDWENQRLCARKLVVETWGEGPTGTSFLF